MNSPRAARVVSKSRLVAFRQCPKRLWLEMHRRDQRADSISTMAVFRRGHEVGDLARRLIDPAGEGSLFDLHFEGVESALEHTRRSLQRGAPIFEAGFRACGALAFADVLLPVQDGSRRRWAMVEVKSSTSPNLRYDDLPGVHDGEMAMQTYVEAVDPTTSATRRAAIEDGLSRYCGLDTRTLVELFRCLHQHGFPNPAKQSSSP